jgi:hypothetical protein
VEGAGDPDPDHDDDDDDNDDEDGDGRSRRGGDRPDKGKGRADENEEPQLGAEERMAISIGRALARERRETLKRPTDSPWIYKHKDHQDIKIWLLVCRDFFERNEFMWDDQKARILYALGRMEGAEVSPIRDTYRKKMTGELGYDLEVGLEQWSMFEHRAIERFAPTHKEEKA